MQVFEYIVVNVEDGAAADPGVVSMPEVTELLFGPVPILARSASDAKTKVGAFHPEKIKSGAFVYVRPFVR